MNIPRTAAASALGVAMLTVPAQSHAAALTANKTCYGGGDTQVLTGTGFTASTRVGLGVNFFGQNRTIGDQQANAAGVFVYRATAPFVLRRNGRTVINTFTATDRAKPSNLARAAVRLRRVRVSIGRPLPSAGDLQRIRATGFTTGQTLYAHIRRGGRGRRVLIGPLNGACRSLSVRRRLFPGGRPGRYRVQFDTARDYVRARPQRYSFDVLVFRTTVRSMVAGAAATGQRWEPIP